MILSVRLRLIPVGGGVPQTVPATQSLILLPSRGNRDRPLPLFHARTATAPQETHILFLTPACPSYSGPKWLFMDAPAPPTPPPFAADGLNITSKHL